MLLVGACGSGQPKLAAAKTAPRSAPTSTVAQTTTTLATSTTTTPSLPLEAASEHGVSLEVPVDWAISDNSTGGSDFLYSWTDPANSSALVKLDIVLCTGCIQSGSYPVGDRTLTAPAGEIARQATVLSSDHTYGAVVTAQLPQADSVALGAILASLQVSAPTSPATTVTPSTTAAPSAQAPTLGIEEIGNVEGFGAVEPSTIYLGGDPTGLVTGIHWSSWGGAEAQGQGMSDYVTGDEAVAQGTQEPVTVVAYALGPCDADSPLAYTEVVWYFAGEGETQSDGGVVNACSDQSG